MMSIDFLLTTLIIVVSPGTGVLFTMATGLSRGSRASVVAAFGCTLGIVPHMAAAILGKLKPGAAGAILNEMEADRASKLAVVLSGTASGEKKS